MSFENFKYNLEDDEMQNLTDKIKNIINEKYKDEIDSIPDHIINTLCQNYIIECKNKNIDINSLIE